MSYLVNGVNREDKALVGQQEVDVVFVNDPPYIIQPAGNALDRLL